MRPYRIILFLSAALAIIINQVDISLPQYLVTEAKIADRIITMLQNMGLYMGGVFLSLLAIHLSYTLLSRLVNRQQKRLLNK